MHWKLTLTLLLLAATGVAGTARADFNPMHNPGNAYDVDDSGRVTPHDFLLIVNQIQRQTAGEVTPLTTAGMPKFYWDTSDNGRVTPHDALLVANHLTVVDAPEPSAIVTAGMGLIFLAGYCWRRRRRAAA